ncbi:ABC transporter ATP-binding protein [candidate division WOR-3 bacterium]|nr:ABC transporter ATP-binding protein [candidate division WOR-3 bacterium]
MTRYTPTPSSIHPNASGFQVKNVSFSYGQKPLFEDLSVAVGCREFCSVVGPNGAGKSTFIKLLARLLEPRIGEILLDDRTLRDYSRRELARRTAYVPQESFFAWDFTVTETVLQGRHSYLKPLERYHSSDYDLVHASLRRLGIEGLASKGINHISSGERQLAVVARSLVQQPSVILLDEPLNHLDLAHQHQALGLLNELNQEGMGVVLVAHDLNQAALVSKRMLVFSDGALVEDGNPDDLLTPGMVEQYWGIKPLQGRHPKSKKRQIFLPF